MSCFVVTFEIGRVPGTGMAHPLLWTGPHRRCKDESLQFPIWSNWKQIILNGQWQKRSLICMKKDWIRKNSGFPVALFTPQPRESGWQNWTQQFKKELDPPCFNWTAKASPGFWKKGYDRGRDMGINVTVLTMQKMRCFQLGKMTGKAGKASWNGHEKTSSPGWAVVQGLAMIALCLRWA